jgi:hypothetical protein
MTDPTNLIRTCIGKHGIWADPVRYREQCWTRDLSLAMAPAAIKVAGEEGRKAVLRHLHSLAARQRKDGSIPILFLDGAAAHARFLVQKTVQSVRRGKPSFMLRRYLSGNLGNLTPGTRDSELHFVRAVLEYGGEDMILNRAAHKAMAYIRREILCEGLFLGADWRDTMDRVLAEKPCLSNNALWYGVLRRAGGALFEAQSLRTALTKRSCGLFGDYPGASRPDPLGLALGVLEGLFGPGHYGDVLDALDLVTSSYGVTIECKHNPQSEEERAVIERTDGIVIWPFVVGYTVLALRKMLRETEAAPRVTGMCQDVIQDRADRIRRMLTIQSRALDSLGLCEWYDPSTGLGYGSQEQGWSAALKVLAYAQ